MFPISHLIKHHDVPHCPRIVLITILTALDSTVCPLSSDLTVLACPRPVRLTPSRAVYPTVLDLRVDLCLPTDVYASGTPAPGNVWAPL